MDKQKQLEARIKLSEEIMAFQKPHKDCVLELATGVGKSGLCLKIVESLSPQSILFVVPQSTMIPNLIADVKKLGFEALLPIMEVICYASLKKYVGKSFSIICFDECHHLFSDIRMSIVEQIQADKRILLSATIDDKIKAKLKVGFDLNIFSCDYHQAVKRGILPELQMEIHSMYLDDVEKIYPHKFKGDKKEKLLTALEYYKVLNKKVKDAVEKWNDRENFKGNPMWLYNRMLRAGGDRQAWVGAYKTEFIKNTIESLGNERMIVFCASKDQAHLLGGNEAVSSDNTKSVNNKIISDFNAGVSNRIFSKGLLVEGQNLVNTPYAIVGGLGSKELRSRQIIGRILRHDSPKLIILVVAGTVDEKYLEQAFKVNIYGERV